jgi:flagellar motility protein MotE (MotC chaperone)
MAIEEEWTTILSPELVKRLHEPMEPRERADAFKRLAASHEAIRSKLQPALSEVDDLREQLRTVNERAKRANERALKAERKLGELEEFWSRPFLRFGNPGDVYLLYREGDKPAKK